MATTFSIEQGRHVFALHHKKKTNCQLDVVLELSAAVGQPQFRNGEWLVPCDVVGLDSKKLKTVKIRFHPSVETLCKEDGSLQDAANRDALKYMDALLEESDWTRNETNAKDRFNDVLDKVSVLLRTTKSHLLVKNDSLVVNWFYKSEQGSTSLTSHARQRFDVSDVLHSFTTKAFSNSLVCNVREDSGTAYAELIFQRDDYTRVIAKLLLNNGFLVTGSNHATLQLTESTVIWTLGKMVVDSEGYPPTLPGYVRLYVQSNEEKREEEEEVALEHPQIELFTLKAQLDESLSEMQRIKTPKEQQRQLNVARNDKNNEMFVEISKAEEVPILVRLFSAASTPLKVNCELTLSDTDLASSPAESTDSGVSLSPVHSPNHNGFFEFSRERSYSESAWGSSLKGILKKPPRWERFVRSVSECHDDEKNACLLITHSPTFGTITDEDEDNKFEDEVVPMMRKKRVSFSEKVEKRAFRSNQCIDAAKKKNQKKKDSRKKKEEKTRSSSVDGETSCDDSIGTASKEDLVFFDDDSKPASCQQQHSDSGFIDWDDEPSTHEKNWKCAVRRVRNASH